MPAVQSRHSEEEIEAAARAMRECPTYSQGNELKAFEAEFAQYVGAEHAAGLSSATAALEMAAMLAGIERGDEVITPAHTFVSTAVPFARTGARIVWADIDPDTRVVSVDTLRPCLTERTRVVVVTHLYGLCAEMEPIAELCRERGIVLVEDCAQSPGAERAGRKAGTFGDFGCFSFHTHKNITTLGEGGMLVCRAKEHDTAARKLRWMGNWPFEAPRQRYWVPAMGDLVAALPGA
jgi:dTDP-4-amino-4,6-dideoxygalactose transaminase